MAKLQFIPSPAIDGFYEVVNTVDAKLINTKIGDVDFSSITLDDANKLYEAGSDYLKRINAKPKNDKKLAV